MAIDFPASPSTNDTHTHNGLTWKYDGTTWVLQATTNNNTFTGLSDTPSSMGSAGEFIKVNTGGSALEFTTAPTDTDTFTGLSDTPSSYTADKFVKVNSGGTALEFTDAPSSTNLGFTITNNGASSYSVDGTSGNPTINLVRGFTYSFNLNVSGHPFWIKTSAVTGTGNAYSTGVTNNGSQTGTLTFSVPLDAPSTLYYICQYHGSMVGTISITNLVDSSAGGIDLSGTWNITL